MNKILADFSVDVVINAIETNITEQYLSLFSHSTQSKIYNQKNLLFFSTGIKHPYLNCVLRAQCTHKNMETKIDEAVNHFTLHGLPMTWHVGPSTRPADLGKHLTHKGLTHTRDETGMAIDLQKIEDPMLAPRDLMIERIQTEESLREWFHTVAISFGYPDFVVHFLFDLYTKVSFGQHNAWQLYVGFLNGKPVGTSRVFLGAGVAGIYHVATVPEVRNQGIGTAMTLASLRRARDLGYRFGVLRAVENALGVYKRIGFKEYCPFHFFTWKSESENNKE